MAFSGKMIPCTQCSKILCDPTDLIAHMKNVHKVRNNWYTCSLCSSTFDELFRFQRHIERCSKKGTRNGQVENVYFSKANEDVQTYKDLIEEASLAVGCKFAANMSVPRNAVPELIDDVQEFMKCMTEGMKNLVLPWLKDDKIHEFESVVSMMTDSLLAVNTEHKLHKALFAKKLISTVRKIKLTKPNESVDPLLVDAERDEKFEDSTEGTDFDENLDEDASSGESKRKTVSLMPIQFQIKSFFEMPNVFETIKSNTSSIMKENKLNHFVNGKLWRSKLKNFKDDELVIPYHLHVDDTQTNNSLGTHTTNGDQTCVYYSFPTMPDKYSARLDNIFTASLFQSSFSKDYGNASCYDALIDELNKLADDGITLNVNGKEQKVFFVIGLLLGDNKGVNDCLGYTTGFTANYYCRICDLHKKAMQYANVEDADSLRTVKSYYDSLMVGNMKSTGLWENSAFNKLRYFHATDACVDIMHDINEGILHYNLCEILLYFIKNKYFTLRMLNNEKRKMKYGPLENNNKSGQIFMDKLEAKKLKMTASETYSFAHHLPFILLNIIHEEKKKCLENDEVWRFLQTTIRFLDMCYMSCFDIESMNKLREVIGSMNEMYVRLFNQTLKPKHHFATHYPSIIEKCGPLRFMSSMRYEAHHRLVKNYSKNTNSRKNIAYSIACKLQYNFAYILKKSVVCDDSFIISKPRLTRIIDEDFYRNIVSSNELQSISNRFLYISDHVKVNGLTLSSKLYIPYKGEKEFILLKIVKIVALKKDDISSVRIICQRYAETNFNSLCAGYQVTNLRPEMYLINISDLLRQRIFPVVLHDVNGCNMFRFKTF